MANKKYVFNWQLYLGFLLVVIGGLFLADQLLETRLIAEYWPALVILFGLTFLIGMLVAGKKGAGLAIPGAVITTLGILLFIQNSFNLWVTWTYAWALLISAIGLGMLIMNSYFKREGFRRVAAVIIGIGLLLFVFFGVFFEIILKIAGTDVQSSVFLGAGLILLGLFVVFSRALFARKRGGEPAQTSAAEVIDAHFSTASEEQVIREDLLQSLPAGAFFTGFNFKCVGEVTLIQGDNCDLQVEGDPELIKKVRTQLQGEALLVTYETDLMDWKELLWLAAEKRLKFTVTIKDLHELHLGGAGMIRGEALSGERLKINHAGLGVLTLKGLQVNTLEVTLGGLGEIRFEGEVRTQSVHLSGGGSYAGVMLRSQMADVTLTGAGSAQVWVESKLTARISGAGSISFKGNPQVDQEITGLGGIKPLSSEENLDE